MRDTMYTFPLKKFIAFTILKSPRSLLIRVNYLYITWKWLIPMSLTKIAWKLGKLQLQVYIAENKICVNERQLGQF